MPKRNIEEFAKVLIREVRDKAIKSCDMLLNPIGKGPRAKRWREQMKDLSPSEFASAIIPDCVDDTIFQLLYAIDNEKLPGCKHAGSK